MNYSSFLFDAVNTYQDLSQCDYASGCTSAQFVDYLLPTATTDESGYFTPVGTSPLSLSPRTPNHFIEQSSMFLSSPCSSVSNTPISAVDDDLTFCDQTQTFSTAFSTAAPQTAWLVWPSSSLIQIFGLNFLASTTGHLPLDGDHWVQLERLVPNPTNSTPAFCLLKYCLRHEDRQNLESRPAHKAVRHLPAYLARLIRQKGRLLQSRPDVVAMLQHLEINHKAAADAVDGRMLQRICDNVPKGTKGPDFLTRGFSEGWWGPGQSRGAETQQQLISYLQQDAWVESLGLY